MASGVQPQNPPHSGPDHTSGPTSASGNNLSSQSDILAETLERLITSIAESGSNNGLNERSQAILAAWTVLSKDSVPKQSLIASNKAKLKKLLRLHQKHVMDERWTDAPDHLKSGLLAALTNAEPMLKACDPSLCIDINYLKSIHANPWIGPVFKTILMGDPDFKSTEYFQNENPELCLKRLQVLVKTKLNLPAYNLASFCIKHIFESTNHTWLNQDREGVQSIMDLYVGLLYKLKKDTSEYLPTLKKLPVSEVLALLARFQDRTESTALLTASTCSKIRAATLDFAMVLAARRKLDESDLTRIVTLWAKSLTQEEISDLEIEVEKFTSLDGQTLQLYEIGLHLYQKFGKKVRQLCLDTMLRGFQFDLNKREVALDKKDDVLLKVTEDALSYGMERMAVVLEDSTAAARECVLTAFSLKPTQALMQKVEALAQKSGFKEGSNPKSDHPTGEESSSSQWKADVDHFDGVCDDFVRGLEAKKYARAYCGPIKERKTRNLDALLSIDGNLITEAANYNPVSAPFPSFTAANLGLGERTVCDLLTAISCSRWHLLSWVLDWPTLQDRCSDLLKNPEIRHPNRELKYLVIDYTQFDEWSSDEEVIASTGIEKGYEDWEQQEDEEEPASVVEKGLDDDEEFDFNVIPKLLDPDDPDDHVSPEDYLPAVKKPRLDDVVIHRAEIELTPTLSSWYQSPIVRQWLRTIVPGLDGLSVAISPPSLHYDVRVVQVTNGSGVVTTSASTTAAPAATVVATTPSVSTPNVVTVQMAAAQLQPPTQVLVPSASSSSSSPVVKSQERKVQYVYKQGGQTIVIDYPENNVPKPVQQVRLVLPPTRAAKTNVDSIANSLISQIQTPLTPTSTGAMVHADAMTGGRVQIAAPQQPKPTAGEMIVKRVIAGPNAGQFIQVQPQPTLTPQRCIIQGPTLTRTAAMPQKINTVIQQKLASVTPIQQVQVRPVQPPPQQQQNQVDLIRQLNMARAQGLVVLQQWGDKQVLVHKATGRWIMRQGNRLVTVPPQALGITTTATATAASVTTVTATSTAAAAAAAAAAAPPKPPLTSNIKEQLAEFDSILESKFKTTANHSQNQDSIISNTSTTATKPPTTSSPPSSAEASKPTRSASLPTSPAKPSTSTAVANPMAAAAAAAKPKPQENPDTMKRIQQILDDYNQQIRNSPDLQNRPAPRRRGQLAAASPKKGKKDPEVQISNMVEPGQITSVKVVSSDAKPAVRQIMMPPGLAASLAASGRQIVVVTGPGGQKMVALKPAAAATKVQTEEEPPNVSLSAKETPASPCSSHSASPDHQTSSPLQTVNLSIQAAPEGGPASPGLGISMELTPGQMMEADITAGDLLDDDMLVESMASSKAFGADDFSGNDDLMGLESDVGLFAEFNKPPMFYEDDEDFQSSSKSSPQTSDEAQSDASSLLSSSNKRKRSSLPTEEIVSTKRTRKPSVKIIEAAESAIAAGRKAKQLIRGSLGSESNCSSSSESGLASQK